MGEAKRRGTYEERKASAAAKMPKMSALQGRELIKQVSQEMLQRMMLSRSVTSADGSISTVSEEYTVQGNTLTPVKEIQSETPQAQEV